MSLPTVDQLDRRVDALAAQCGEPTIVCVDCPHGESVFFGIAGGSAFVSNTGQLPYFATVGDADAEGFTNFDFEAHDTEIANRHLISMDLARQVVREYFLTGNRSTAVEWQEI